MTVQEKRKRRDLMLNQEPVDNAIDFAGIKKPAKAGSFISGGERGIRTLDTL
ncbi:hypothetical protein [Alteromonas gilva]|uniref:Uncharacterized protein n=1 Tax=Alteromonas gilva TaxID=2987522 RepID=A0ABT5L6Y1_9ALTE|nr:hypothetical protein [Alteromonas gilva]MDC8831518.1 hypothetical protein [Alteromonas gilva]